MGFHLEWCLGSSMKNLLNQAACAIKLRLVRRRAAVAIMVALSAPVLLGMAGLVTDVTYWYGSRQAMQLAADAGAMAAARSGQTTQATLQTVAINAANLATNNRYAFNANNLAVTLTNGGASFKTPSGTQSVPSSSSSSTSFSTVTVTAKTPAPVFFSAIIGVPQGALAASASSTLRQNIQPPNNSTLLSLTGNTGPTFHVGGLNFVPNDQINQNFTSVGLNGGTSGQIQSSSAAYISNNNQSVNSGATGTLISNNAPPCTDLLGALNASTLNTGSGATLTTTGITSTTWNNGQGGTVKVYFGAGTTIQSTEHPGIYVYVSGRYKGRQCYPNYRGAYPTNCAQQPATYTYSIPTTTDPNSGATVPEWSPVVVTPTTSVDGSLYCAQNGSNTPTATCDIPAAAYCGGLTVNPGSTINFTNTGGDGQAFMILDGNAIMPNSAAPTLVAYTSTDPQYSFNFGGSYVGGLLNTTQTTIYPGEIQQGAVIYTTTETETLYSGSYSYVDQVCPAGVLPDGLTSNSNAQCAGISQTTSNGVTNTSTVGTGNSAGIATNSGYCPQGDTCGANGGLSFSASQGSPVTFVDSYVTSVYFISGVPTYAQVSETSYYCYGTTCSPDQASGNLYLVTGQNINPNNSAPPPTTAQLTCSAGAANNLYSATTGANEGYSTATSYSTQTDSVQVCGSGPKLVAIASNGTILVSAVNSSNLWMSD
jgi:Flp pilus assembly protein TadG